MSSIIYDEELGRAVDSLIRGVVPERSGEWENLKRRYAPQFVFATNEPGRFLMGKVVGQNVVTFSERTRDIIWMLGFGSWRMHQANADALFLEGPPYTLANLSVLPNQAEVDNAVTEIMMGVGYLYQMPGMQPFTWPAGVPSAEEFLKRCDDPTQTPKEEKAAYDLTCMGMAFILLHEMHHLVLEQDRLKPTDPREEEYACDHFALVYLMKHHEILTAGAPQVLTKRAMGIFMAMFVLLAMSLSPQWGQVGTTHPPLAGRVKALVKELDLTDNDLLWIFMGSLLVGLLRHQAQPLPALSAPTPKHLCHQIIDWIGTIS